MKDAEQYAAELKSCPGCGSDVDSMDYLVKIGRKVSELENGPVVKEIKGATYLFRDGKPELMREVDPVPPDKIEAYTLQGLVDFIGANVDGLFTGDKRYTVRIANHKRVEILSPLVGVENKRHLVAFCDAKTPTIKLNSYMPAEDMSIQLQTCFENDEQPGEDKSNRDKVLSVVGSLVSDQNMQTADDGFSQRVTVKQGIATNGVAVVKNPVYLTPFRTFHEVEQPESAFVLRFKEGPMAALFEADGGYWMLQAVNNIRKWLTDMLADQNVEIIA